MLHWVKDLALSLLWHGFNPKPGNVCIPWPKNKFYLFILKNYRNIKERKKILPRNDHCQHVGIFPSSSKFENKIEIILYIII